MTIAIPPISLLIGFPPDQTVRAFEARDTLRTTVRWSEMWHGEHARAFTVAKVAKLDMLTELQASIADMLANGGTFEQWRDGILPYLQKQGWWGEVRDRELTGTDDAVHVGPRRLRTIYDTNLRVSRAAGRWTRIQALKGERPFLRYTAVMDARTRPEHRRWHGTILPVDHPWWDTHYPPCGWHCRCLVRQLSQRDLDRRGWKVTTPPADGPPRPFYRAGSDQPVLVPQGISPGFAYNPGKASMAAVAEKATRSLEAAARTDLDAARSTLRDLVDGDGFLETLAEPGSAFPVMVLGPGLRAAIGSEAAVVRLSADTFAKQQGLTARSEGHPDLTVRDYRRLPAIGATPDHAFVDRDRHVVLMRAEDDRWWYAVIKATLAGDELYLESLRRGDDRNLRRLQARFPDLLA